jgi:hypothetical protein
MFVRRVLPPTLALAVTAFVVFWPSTTTSCDTTTDTDLGIFSWGTWPSTIWKTSEPPFEIKPLLLVRTLALCFAIWAIALKVALGSVRRQPQKEPAPVG